MSDEGWFQRQSRGKILLFGILGGLLAGAVFGASGMCYVNALSGSSSAGNQMQLASTCSVPSEEFPSSLVIALGNSKPTRSLRLIQAIGILLPLFTGLLRFTTDPSSKAGSRANGLLFIGIVGLVLGGVVAAFSGIFTSTALILKVALSFVVITFAIIGWVAGRMLNEMLDSTDRKTDLESERRFGPVGVKFEASANAENDEAEGKNGA